MDDWTIELHENLLAKLDTKYAEFERTLLRAKGREREQLQEAFDRFDAVCETILELHEYPTSPDAWISVENVKSGEVRVLLKDGWFAYFVVDRERRTCVGVYFDEEPATQDRVSSFVEEHSR